MQVMYLQIIARIGQQDRFERTNEWTDGGYGLSNIDTNKFT